MLLGTLQIENFRSLRSVTLGELGRVNLLVGKNNCGKTTVLESLRVLASGGALKTLMDLSVERDEQPVREKPEEFETYKQALSGLFTDHEIDSREIRLGDFQGSNNLTIKRVFYRYINNQNKLLIEKSQILTSLEAISAVENFEVDENDLDEGLQVSVAEKQVALISLGNNPGTSLTKLNKKSAIFACENVSAHPDDVNELSNLWDQIVLTDLEKIAVQALQLIDPAIEGVTFVEANRNMENWRGRYTAQTHKKNYPGRRIPVVKLKNSKYKIPLKSMGDGLHRVLDVILRLVAVQDGFLLIDEFENGLHYSIHEKLWHLIFTVATERNVQVFVTTHSDDCVKAFTRVSLQSEEKGVLYRLVRPETPEQAHFVRRYSEETLEEAEEADVEVR